jgi:hypothetical protein
MSGLRLGAELGAPGEIQGFFAPLRMTTRTGKSKSNGIVADGGYVFTRLVVVGRRRQRQEQPQIPFGDDNQRGQGVKAKAKAKAKAKGKGKGKRKRQRQKAKTKAKGNSRFLRYAAE